jgi:hypothetical protein
VERFAPLVAAVFGDAGATGVELPWRLTDRSQQHQAGIGRTLEELQWDLDYLLQLWQAIEASTRELSEPFLGYQ